jgi:hypothetical protein
MVPQARDREAEGRARPATLVNGSIYIVQPLFHGHPDCIGIGFSHGAIEQEWNLSFSTTVFSMTVYWISEVPSLDREDNVSYRKTRSGNGVRILTVNLMT